MRISDWSSDVCSSDLLQQADEELPKLRVDHGDRQEPIVIGALLVGNDAGASAERPMIAGLGAGNCRKCQRREQQKWPCETERKRVVWGKSVAVRVTPGGRLILTKKTRNIKKKR